MSIYKLGVATGVDSTTSTGTFRAGQRVAVGRASAVGDFDGVEQGTLQKVDGFEGPLFDEETMADTELRHVGKRAKASSELKDNTAEPASSRKRAAPAFAHASKSAKKVHVRNYDNITSATVAHTEPLPTHQRHTTRLQTLMDVEPYVRMMPTDRIIGGTGVGTFAV